MLGAFKKIHLEVDSDSRLQEKKTGIVYRNKIDVTANPLIYVNRQVQASLEKLYNKIKSINKIY